MTEVLLKPLRMNSLHSKAGAVKPQATSMVVAERAAEKAAYALIAEEEAQKAARTRQ